MPLFILPLFFAALFGTMPHRDATIAPRVPYAAAASPKKSAATTPAPAVKSQPAAAATVQKTVQSAPVAIPTALEAAVIAGINAARFESGLKPLSADGRLSAIARAHSADMLTNDYFDHTSLSGCGAVCRYQNAGYTYWSMAENIYWMSGYTLSTDAAAQKVVDGWQNSPGHRANDLGDFTNVGVGIAQSGTKIYVTADFSTPR